jgi:hypothetical protein
MSARDSYKRWTYESLARRAYQYSGYIGCGCYEERHNPMSQVCARADFVRLASELKRRRRTKGGSR